MTTAWQMTAVPNGTFAIEPGAVVAVLSDPYGTKPLIVDAVQRIPGTDDHAVDVRWLQENSATRPPNKWILRRGRFLMSSLHRIGGPAL